MDLYIVRHAKAAPAEEFDGPDAERPLTEKGRERFQEALEEFPWPKRTVRILSSPILRARQTAAMLAEHLATGFEVCQELTSGVEPDAIVRFARSKGEGPFVIVGHNPELEGLVSKVTRQRTEMKPGAIVHLTLPEQR